MTAATANRAPSEAEIREIIEARLKRYPSDNPYTKIEDGIAAAFDAVAYTEVDPAGWSEEPRDNIVSDLWADLRPSEAQRLQELIDEHLMDATNEARELVRRHVVTAALTFSAEHPNAPRAEPEPA